MNAAIPDPPPHDLAADRNDYLAGSLADDAPADPMGLFDTWIEAAFARRDSHEDLPDPTALVLSTVDIAGSGAPPRPRSRTALLKEHDADGFVVYTNKLSAKGQEITANPWAAMLFPWYPLQRQIRIEGAVEDLPAEQSDAYWATRPRPSQIGAWASHQSRPVHAREDLDAEYARITERFADTERIPRPEHWGGYRLVPDRIEFWQGRGGRMHDRIVYERAARGAEWTRTRLQP